MHLLCAPILPLSQHHLFAVLSPTLALLKVENTEIESQYATSDAGYRA
jgi:hypothetical protein